MRGKVTPVCVGGTRSRITPAYAGKSGVGPRDRSGRPDHPRVCGEKHLRQPGTDGPYRITPAYAGKRKATLVSLMA